MNERKNAIHASLVAEHRQLLREHNQVRTLAVQQATELRELRGKAFFCRLSFAFSFRCANVEIASCLGAAASTVQADPAEIQTLRQELDQAWEALEERVSDRKSVV